MDQVPLPPERENPFQSPQQPGAEHTSDSSRATTARRVVIVVLSVLLIPPSVIIAFFFACLVSGGPFDSMAIGIFGGTVIGLAVLVGLCYIANKLWKIS